MTATARKTNRKVVESRSIAIVGMSCRMPAGANSPEQLWQVLQQGGDGIRELPEGRWDPDRWYHPDPKKPGKIYVQRGGYLDAVDMFDAAFFGISPREAAQMDPQQRLLLEMAWEALEDAGQAPETLAGTHAGVFIGVSNCDYGALPGRDIEWIDAYSNTGAAISIAANRVSYFFDLRGPSVALDTACSSSLVAIHQACQSIWRGESSLALAGGVNLVLRPEPGIGFCKASMLSKRGEIRSFDAEADGFVRAEGGGVLVLKPLQAALASGNPIHALILATAVNTDGRTTGIFLPSKIAQAELLRDALRQAATPARDVCYVEAHGTGTSVGDPIECAAIGSVIGAERDSSGPCLIGSIKSNIGHLEPASGVAGTIKAVLCLKHHEVPANLHFETPNPNIPFDKLNLEVVRERKALPSRRQPLVAAVNSFGFGGANAAVVLQEYKAPRVRNRAIPEDHAIPLVLSARSADALLQLTRGMVKLLRQPDAPAVYDICHSAAFRRARLNHRLVAFGKTAHDLADKLAAMADGSYPEIAARDEALRDRAKLAFVFSGNGPQWWAMGRELLKESVFRTTVENIDVLFKALADWSLLKELLASEETSRMHMTEVAQPALFAIQVGVVELLRSWGTKPDAMVGHSVGEVAAAYTSGALTLQQAVKVIYARSTAQAPTAGEGKMAAIGLSAEEAEAIIAPLGGALVIAAINSPRAVTVSGDVAALEIVGREIQERGAFFRLLDLDYAFHSAVMDRVEKPLLSSLEGLSPSGVLTRFVSSVNGEYLEGPELGPTYWWDNVRKPVLFQTAVERLLDDGVDVFLEIGPHPVLAAYLKECTMAKGQKARAVATLRRGEPDCDAVLTAVGQCYVLGCGIDLQAFFPVPGRCCSLLSYPWQRERYWVEHNHRPSDHPLLGDRMETTEPVWNHRLDTPLVSYLSQHVVHGAAIFPAAGFLEMALAAAHLLHNGGGAFELNDVELRRALLLPDDLSPTVQLSVSEIDGGFTISSRSNRNEAWTVHVVGKLGVAVSQKGPEALSIEALRSRMTRHATKDALYEIAKMHGLQYGPAFQGVAEMWGNQTEGISRIEAPEPIRSDLSHYHLHPGVLDACFQGVLAMGMSDDTSWLPVGIRRMRFLGNPNIVKYCYLRLEHEGVRAKTAALRLLDGDGGVVAEVDGFRVQQVDLARSTSTTTPIYEWRPQYQPGSATTIVPSALPMPRKIAENLAPKICELIVKSKRKELYEGFKRRTDALCGAYVASAFEKLGAREKPFTVSSLMQEHGVLTSYQRLLSCYIEMLEEDGIIYEADGKWRFRADATRPDPDEELREIAGEAPEALAELVIASECGDRLSDILTGKVDALQILSQAPLEHLYESSPTTRFYNQVMREVVVEIAKTWPKDRTLRVLEVGAGTGGTTTQILPFLPEYRTHYVFTDVSDIFLAKAESKFSNFPFMRYQKLDIEHDPIDQGFVAGSFDLVIAAFVLHVTADLRQTLRNVRRLLTTNGQLLLLEVHDEGRLQHLAFGLLKGWWAFADTDLRTKSPLLTSGQWQNLLQESGFDECVVLNDSDIGRSPHQSVILTRSPKVEQVQHGAARLSALRRWLVFADDGGSGLGGEVACSLASEGHQVIRIQPGSTYTRLDDTSFAIPVGDKDAYLRLLQHLQEANLVCDEVLHFWGLTDALELPGDESVAGTDRRTVSLLFLIQAMRQAMPEMPRLWIMTNGATIHSSQAIGTVRPAQGPAWGLGRVLQNYTRCKLIEVQLDQNPAETLDLLLAEFRNPDQEDEILLINGARFANRIRRTSVAEQADYFRPALGADRERAAFQLDFVAQGPLDNLYLRAMSLPRPGPTQVLIKVRATALNFHDVLWVMGVLPAEAVEHGFAGPTLGMECAGEVAAVGDEVREFVIGDEVIALAANCFASHVTADEKMLVRKPKHISFEAAAGLPTAFFTAQYALDALAQMQPGERLLIHGAAGGVGLAAVQIAKLKGLEIFGTAGTPQKRRFLEKMGVDHVLDSRSLAFADDIMEITSGTGVDAVLNSLAGEAIYRNLTVLKPFGRFLEIGRRDHFANTKMGLRPFSNNISYFGIDVDQLIVERPVLARRVFRQIMEMFEQGALKPLVHRVFPISRVVDAFRHMQQGAHIGKIVVSMDDDAARVRSTEKRTLALREDGTYVITGGLGGFGMATARWMVEKGARHLVLLGRSGASTDEAKAGVADLEAAGARVLVTKTDVAKEEQLRQVFDAIEKDFPPLRGVVHAVLVLDDASPFDLTLEQWHRVMEPKVRGAWNLHQLTLKNPLDFFILYSSAATLIGNPGQPNYVAANLYLESLAAYRRSLGLPGMAVGWGAIADVGYVARAETIRQLLQQRGLVAMDSRRALDTLEQLMAAGALNVAVAEIDWPKIFKTLGTADRPKYEHVRHELNDPGSGTQLENLKHWLSELPEEEQLGKLTELLAEQLAKVLRISTAKIDVNKSILDMGVDSLMTVELATTIEKNFGVELSVMELMNRVSLTDIAERILNKTTISSGTGEDTIVGPHRRPPDYNRPKQDKTIGKVLAENELSYSELSKCAIYGTHDGPAAHDLQFHQVGAVLLRPRLDPQRLGAAFARVVQLHAALRTTYPGRGTQRRRHISPTHPRGLEIFNAETLTDAEARALLQSRATDTFDLGKGPLFQLQLYHRSDNRDILLLKFHEIVADVWSLMVVADDLFKAYIAPDDLRSDHAPYTEFARWQRALVESQRGTSLLNYWRKKLKNLGPPLELPFDRPRQPGPVMRAGTRDCVLDPTTTAAVSCLAAANDATLYGALLAAFNVVLYGYTGCTDLVVTGVSAGRTRPEFQRLVGSVSRRLWLRNQIDAQQPYDLFLKQISRNIAEGLEHQDYPASLVYKEVQPAHETALNQVGFSVVWPEHMDDKGLGVFVVNVPGASVEYAGFYAESVPLQHKGAVRDLHVLVHPFGGLTRCDFRYNSDLFDASTIERVIDTYLTVLRAAVADPKQSVAQLAAVSSSCPRARSA